MNTSIIEEIIKTVITVIIILFFIGSLSGLNNRDRYKKCGNGLKNDKI